MINCMDSKGQPKRRYDSEYEALDAANCARVERNANLRVYRCPSCRGWHLTSRPGMSGAWGRGASRW